MFFGLQVHDAQAVVMRGVIGCRQQQFQTGHLAPL
jgi:hypothetical protein